MFPSQEHRTREHRLAPETKADEEPGNLEEPSSFCLQQDRAVLVLAQTLLLLLLSFHFVSSSLGDAASSASPPPPALPPSLPPPPVVWCLSLLQNRVSMQSKPQQQQPQWARGGKLLYWVFVMRRDSNTKPASLQM